MVEDEFLIRLILAEALVEAGFDVVEAGRGEEAIGILQASSGFHLVITDVQMQDSPDGIAVARCARALFPDMPIVFATARPDSIRGFGDRGPHDAIVPKPYGPEQILAVVRASLGR